MGVVLACHSERSEESRKQNNEWIPAFAGMTTSKTFSTLDFDYV